MQRHCRYRCGGVAGDYAQLIREVLTVVRGEMDVEAEGASSRKGSGELSLAVNAERGV
jgi:hypothetical protein